MGLFFKDTQGRDTSLQPWQILEKKGDVYYVRNASIETFPILFGGYRHSYRIRFSKNSLKLSDVCTFRYTWDDNFSYITEENNTKLTEFLLDFNLESHEELY